MSNRPQTQVKVCGLTRAQDVRAAIDAGADYLGFIIEANSSRRLSVENGAALIQGLSKPCVAVTVDPDDALVAAIRSAGFSHIQLHGSEDLRRTAEIARSGLGVIKAVKVETADDVKIGSEYSGAADILLFDAKPPKGAEQEGGHGSSFDWSILHHAPTPKIWALAGGLKPGNVGGAVAVTGAPIVDVSSGVERTPGVKDSALITAFIGNARGTITS